MSQYVELCSEDQGLQLNANILSHPLHVVNMSVEHHIFETKDHWWEKYWNID